MSEFKLQHIVAELLDELGGNVPPERLVEYLQKSQNVNVPGCAVSIQNHLIRLEQDLPNAGPFISKYNYLKDKNVDCLNPFVQILDHISQHPGVKEFLLKSTKPIASGIKTELTKDDLPQLKNRLKKAISKKPTKDELVSGVLNVSSTVPLAITPSVKSWVQRRPKMSWDFTIYNNPRFLPVVPVVSQEDILTRDVLNTLMGMPGRYIEPVNPKDAHGSRTFKVNVNIPLALRDLVNQILPLANSYSIIQRFIEEKYRFEFGEVNNALAESMEKIINDHVLFVLQLDTEFRARNLNLQKLWFFLQKNVQHLGSVAQIASAISKSDAKGGKVLTLLHENVTGLVDESQKMRMKLMEAACVPYMKMLEMWICKGIICDPVNEFLVEDNEVIQKEDMPDDYAADYWEKKYSIRRERIPKFLETAADVILKTGKYLNVIRQCGKPIENNLPTIVYKTEERHYMKIIEKAYIFASNMLLEMILKEKDLIGRLKSVKHYFLLEKGDFIVTFLSLCEKELGKFVVDINQASLMPLMDLALRLSSSTCDPYKENLRIELLQYDLQFQMFKILSIQTNSEEEYWSMAEPKKLRMIESFAFSYEVKWPLSLILNRKALACYQMIFRLLFLCKYTERMICQVWKSNKVTKKFHFKDAQHYRSAFSLRQRMSHCVVNLEYHMLVEVIEPHWHKFMKKINKVDNVDDILIYHSDFLDSCLKDCMLTIPAILGNIIDLLGICDDYCIFMQNEFASQGAYTNPEVAPSFKEKISLFDAQFSGTLMKLLDQISELKRDASEHDMVFNLIYSVKLLPQVADEQPKPPPIPPPLLENSAVA